MTAWGMRSGFRKINFSEPCRCSLHITAALWVAVICRNIEAVTTRRSWKFVGQAEAKKPKPLGNTDYFATLKIAKTRISNVISNTFQTHNLIRRNIEAVTTRRSWKPFAQKARGFESLFLRQKWSTKPRGWCFYFCLEWEDSNAPLWLSESQNGVRIPHPKIEELALQAQGVGIFVKDEYPSSKPLSMTEWLC